MITQTRPLAQPMNALIVPIGLVRRAIDQSVRMGMAETPQDVIQRLLADLRDPRHPSLRGIRAAPVQTDALPRRT